VAVHELGHSVGLDHSNDQGSIMYPIIRPNIALPQRDDINGVQALYGRRAQISQAGSSSVDLASAVDLTNSALLT
jgi:hypothetical protein